MASFYEVLTEAINDIVEHGFDDLKRVEDWLDKIRKAAKETMISDRFLEELLKRKFGSIFNRQVEQEAILKVFPGVSKFTLENVKPKLRDELDRRIMNSATLIKLNRDASIERTLQRFQGWATSIPAGGTKVADKNDVKANVKKALAQLPFEERRVIIDQGHKFTSELSSILAEDANAIAGVWHSHWKQSGYDYRKDHKERDEKVYAIRDNWAIKKGLMNKGAGYTDEMTKPGEEVYCRCFMKYIFNVRDLPKEMLTKKGAEELEAVRAKIKAMRAG